MFMSTKEAAAKWGISERRVRVLCAQGRVDGAIQSSWAYLIPTTSAKPRDGRQLRHQKQEHLRLGGSGLEALQTVRATDRIRCSPPASNISTRSSSQVSRSRDALSPKKI